jgi:hypothetical protein
MELNFTDGEQIAYVEQSAKPKYIYVKNKNDGGNEKKTNFDSDEVSTILEEVIRNTKGRITNKSIEELAEALKSNNPTLIKSDVMRKVYDDVKTKGNVSGKDSVVVKDGGVVPCYDKNVERKVSYIAGMSGSGKSTIASKMIYNYHKTFPNNRVILFSNKPEDPALDKHKFLIRAVLDEELYTDPFTLDDIRDTLIIYDDVEYIKDKEINNELDRLRDLILQQGRSYHISFLYICHQLTNYRNTRIILNEMMECIIFPTLTTTYSLKYLTEKYYGMNKNELMKLKSLPSRYVCLRKLPPCVIYDKGAYLID